MIDFNWLFLFPLIVSGVVSFVATFWVIKNAKRLKIIDDPKKSNHPKVIHKKPTPRGGGIPIFISILIACLVFLPLDKYLIGILIGAGILLIVGFFDDRHDLNPYLRLILGFLAAAAPILAGVGISFVSNPLGGVIDFNTLIANVFAIVWIVFMMNMVNMGAKGVDGQLSGVILIAALTIAFLSIRFSADITQWPVIILASITAGSFLGFLPWHIFPQKIMPGYGGSIMAGYMLAVLSILSTTKVGTLMIVLGIPLIDTGYVVIRRILAGKSPVWGDRGHLHHRLLDAGLSKAQVAMVYWGFSLVLGIMAINLNTPSKLYTMIGITLFVGGLILFLSKNFSNKNDK